MREMKKNLRKLLSSRKKNSVKARLLCHLIGGTDESNTNLLSDTLNESKSKINKTKEEFGPMQDDSIRNKLNKSNFELQEDDNSSQFGHKQKSGKRENLFRSTATPVTTSLKFPAKEKEEVKKEKT